MWDSKLINPWVIGHIPPKPAPIVHGSSSLDNAVYPYAMTINVAVTFPLIDETPLMLMLRILVSGENDTLNKDAEKLELDIQGFKDVDSMILSAATLVANVVKASSNEPLNLDNERRMMGEITSVLR